MALFAEMARTALAPPSPPFHACHCYLSSTSHRSRQVLQRLRVAWHKPDIWGTYHPVVIATFLAHSKRKARLITGSRSQEDEIPQDDLFFDEYIYPPLAHICADVLITGHSTLSKVHIRRLMLNITSLMIASSFYWIRDQKYYRVPSGFVCSSTQSLSRPLLNHCWTAQTHMFLPHFGL